MSERPARQIAVSWGTLGLFLQIAGVILLMLWCFGVVRSSFPWPWFSVGLYFLGSLL